MLRLRKGKKTIELYDTAYDLASDADTLKTCFKNRADMVADFLRKNAFAFAITGGKARLGEGYVFEHYK